MMFIDGVGKVLEENNSLSSFAPSGRPFTICGIPAATTGSSGHIGSYDEFRFTKGVARYHADFTPPTTAFPQIDGTEVTSTYEAALNITNGGAESGTTTGWTSSTNFDVRSASPAPYAGSYYFIASTNTASAYAYQDVDLSYYATDIDAGDAYIELNFVETSFSGDDTGYIELDFLNGSDVSQGTVQSIEFAAEGTHWCPIRIPKTLIPSTTRKVRIGIYGNRTSGTANDAYFDTITGKIYSETDEPTGGGGTVTTIVIG